MLDFTNSLTNLNLDKKNGPPGSEILTQSLLIKPITSLPWPRFQLNCQSELNSRRPKESKHKIAKID